MAKRNTIKLGDKVRDDVTGFEGIVTSVHSYLHACRRIGVSPPVDKEGKHVDGWTIDEPQLTVIEVRSYVPPVDVNGTKNGGPTTRGAGTATRSA